MKKPDIRTLARRLDDSACSIRDLSADADELQHADDLDAAVRLLRVLDRIHEEMDGEEWDSDTTGAIGDILTGAGFEINPPGFYDEEE